MKYKIQGIDVSKELFGAVLGMLGLFFALGVIYGISMQNSAMEKRAIENQCAYYDPSSGDFKWLGEKNNNAK